MFMQNFRPGTIAMTLLLAVALAGIGRHAGAEGQTSGGYAPRGDRGAGDRTAVNAAASRHFVIYNNYREMFEAPALLGGRFHAIVDEAEDDTRFSFTVRNLAASFASCSMRPAFNRE